MLEGAAAFDRVRGIVVRIAGPERVPANLEPDTPLGEGGLWLDSVELLEVILACERAFDAGPDAAAADLPPDALRTLGTLAAWIWSRTRI
jgi:acyl carrier protein